MSVPCHATSLGNSVPSVEHRAGAASLRDPMVWVGEVAVRFAAMPLCAANNVPETSIPRRWRRYASGLTRLAARGTQVG